MSIALNMTPEAFADQVLMRGIKELLRESIRAKLHAEADRIVEEVLQELPTATLRAIHAMRHFQDERVEIHLHVERPAHP